MALVVGGAGRDDGAVEGLVAAVDIRLLGPVEFVSSAGTLIVIRSAKRRELLALLAAHAPEVISADRIIDALWGDESGDHVRALRFHVSKLRDVVDPDRGGGVVVTKAPGYGLGIDPEAVDAHRFAALVAEAEGLGADDVAEVGRLIEEALELWRGSPYAEFTYTEWARSEIRRLEELRLIATELRINAGLATGRHSGLVPELESLVVEYPLQEQFWSQLMVALYRSGRQPEALRAYRRASDVFAELGTVPSEELARLEEQVLLRDSALELVKPERVVLGNLPTPLSSFVGRAAEIDTVRRLVQEQRLVTLTGPGGVGKTRLAIEAARGLVGQVADGVWLVELADIDDGDLVPSEVTGTLGMPVAGEDLRDRLVRHLRGREAVLVVDNCEHLVGSVSELLIVLLTRCPQLRALVTSRQPLGIDGEVIWYTGPLPVEPDERSGTPEAVELFLDRARAVQPSLGLTDETAPLAVEVCRHHAGLPLAIELAAARLRMMSLPQIAQRLGDEFELLTDGPAQAVEHHRAMRATLDWSYRLLDPEAQSLFRRLAVFRGGFTLDTAERFHGSFPNAAGKVLELVGRLVDASMVLHSVDDRYMMLEPIRQYGLLLLDEHRETAVARNLHAALIREMFQVPDSVLFAPDVRVPGITDVFITEMDNVRAALTWTLDSGDTTSAIELGAVAGTLFGVVGSQSEGIRWLDRVLGATSEATPHRARALTKAVHLALWRDGPDRGQLLVDELASTAEALDDEQWRAVAIERQAFVECVLLNLDTAANLWEEATERLLRLDHPEAWVPLFNYQDSLLWEGDYERADVMVDRVAGICGRFDLPYAADQAHRDHSYIAVCRGDPDDAERHLAAIDDHLEIDKGLVLHESAAIRGYIALLRDDLDEAERLGSVAIADARKSRMLFPRYEGLVLVGLVHFHRGDAVTAHRYLIEVLREATRTGLFFVQQGALDPLAATMASIDPAKGAVLLGAVEASNRRDGRRPPFAIARATQQAIATLEETLPADELEEAWHRGAAMTLDDAIAFALETT
jgi:predicted ATPase